MRAATLRADGGRRTPSDATLGTIGRSRVKASASRRGDGGSCATNDANLDAVGRDRAKEDANLDALGRDHAKGDANLDALGRDHAKEDATPRSFGLAETIVLADDPISGAGHHDRRRLHRRGRRGGGRYWQVAGNWTPMLPPLWPGMTPVTV